MDTIQNVQTQTAYASALTLGPDDYEGISASIWNQTCWYQVWQLDSGGHHQLGDWGAEIASAPSAFTIQRCGGIRFRTNPNTPSSPAIVNAWAWKDSEPVIIGGLQLQGSLATTG